MVMSGCTRGHRVPSAIANGLDYCLFCLEEDHQAAENTIKAIKVETDKMCRIEPVFNILNIITKHENRV
jgi:hypothetical protein